MLQLSRNVAIPDNEIEMQAVRSQGAGGQNVNKVSSAIHLRFDIRASSLPEGFKEKLLDLNDRRVSKEGIVIIKAQQHRTQEQNRAEALCRLKSLIKSVMYAPPKRVATKPTKGSKKRRLDSKAKRGQRKTLRGKVDY
ncbi:alternative ribosome rescue aminoacyl-tRNA hydrolase ArfB [Halomonas shantousis]